MKSPQRPLTTLGSLHLPYLGMKSLQIAKKDRNTLKKEVDKPIYESSVCTRGLAAADGARYWI